MRKNDIPTLQDIEELTAYLPRLYAEGFSPIESWNGGEKLKAASLSEIKTMLTYCVRGERFSDGHWAAMIEKGYIRRVLERLNEIKLELK